MSDDLRNLVWRCLHTFWQTFSVAFLIPDSWWDIGAWKAVGFAALAAALSAVKTFIAGFLAGKTSDDPQGRFLYP